MDGYYQLGGLVMMQLGTFQFGISTAAYQELDRKTAWRWAQQDVIGTRPALQFTGPGEDAITLQGVVFPEYRGGSYQVEHLRTLAGRGKPQLLVSGMGELFGRWVIESVAERQTVFAAFGKARRQEFTVQLKRLK